MPGGKERKQLETRQCSFCHTAKKPQREAKSSEPVSPAAAATPQLLQLQRHKYTPKTGVSAGVLFKMALGDT